MDAIIDKFEKLYLHDQGIDEIVIDLASQTVSVRVDQLWILSEENPVWPPGLGGSPMRKNCLIFVGCDEVSICPQGCALDGLILTHSAIRMDRCVREGKVGRYRFEFLIAGRPSAVTLRIEADDFQLVSGESDSAEISFENRD